MREFVAQQQQRQQQQQHRRKVHVDSIFMGSGRGGGGSFWPCSTATRPYGCRPPLHTAALPGGGGGGGSAVLQCVAELSLDDGAGPPLFLEWGLASCSALLAVAGPSRLQVFQLSGPGLLELDEAIIIITPPAPKTPTTTAAAAAGMGTPVSNIIRSIEDGSYYSGAEQERREPQQKQQQQQQQQQRRRRWRRRQWQQRWQWQAGALGAVRGIGAAAEAARRGRLAPDRSLRLRLRLRILHPPRYSSFGVAQRGATTARWRCWTRTARAC